MPGPKPGALPLGQPPSSPAKVIILKLLNGRYTDGMKRLFTKKLTLVLVLSLIALGVVVYGQIVQGKSPSAKDRDAIVKTQTSKSTKKPNGVLKFAALGDMLAHDSIVAQARSGETYDFTPYFKNIRETYRDADVVFCNPETLSAGATYGISGYPSFNAPTEFARDLMSGAGCGIINLATNHINDKGQAALGATVAVWEDLKPLAFSGANRSPEEQSQIRYFTQNGMTVAFLAFADYSNNSNLTPYGLNLYHNQELVRKLVSTARSEADAVVVSAHWGTEDSNVVNTDQMAAARLFAESGADVVIGTGPHVLQKAEFLTSSDGRKTLVWYSIGNMLSSQLKVDELTGVVAGFTLQKQKDGQVVVSDPTAQITLMSYDWAPADRAAQRLEARSNLRLRTLSASDEAASAMFGTQYTQAERENYVRATLGNSTGLKVTP